MSASVTSYPDRRIIAKTGRTKTCSRCGWSNVRPSPRRGFAEYLLAMFWIAPFRCRNCRHRFFRFSSRTVSPLSPIPAVPLRVVPRSKRPHLPEEATQVQPSPVKPELRAWALGGPVAPDTQPAKPAKTPAPVYAFAPPPIERIEPQVENITTETAIPEDSGEITPVEPPALELAGFVPMITLKAIVIEPATIEIPADAVPFEQSALIPAAPASMIFDEILSPPEPSDIASVEGMMEEPALEEAQSILILDREEPIRKLLRRVLERQGYRVQEMGSSRDLSTELLPASVDLLITDPEEQVECLRTIQTSFPEVPIIVLSNSWEGDLTTCAVLEKPFRTETLLQSVRNALS